jgi:signal-transduction protein with cAMP-binding, CBS, and nucleotidyltransferase domain
MHLRGRILSNIPLFKPFGFDFLSQVAYKFETTMFVVDDVIFVENDVSDSMYYITEGKIALIHKASHTIVRKDVGEDEIFGEVGLFSGNQRLLSARALDFTSCSMLHKKEVLKLCELFARGFKAMKKIQADLRDGDYSTLNTKCYLCGGLNHLALDCAENFKKIRGNMLDWMWQLK